MLVIMAILFMLFVGVPVACFMSRVLGAFFGMMFMMIVGMFIFSMFLMNPILLMLFGILVGVLVANRSNIRTRYIS